MTLLGELYANGLGVPQNDKKAAEWYKLAADRGDREAMFALAMFSLAGRAGPRDREASAKWLAAAAKLGQPLAAYDLALLYMEGQLFPQDFGRAAELLRTAAQAGNAEAQYALGTLYKDRPRRAAGQPRGGAAVRTRVARRQHRSQGRIRASRSTTATASPRTSKRGTVVSPGGAEEQSDRAESARPHSRLRPAARRPIRSLPPSGI